MDRVRTPRRPATGRLLAVCAVLFGLFLMHGAPSAAASGCHGFIPGAMPMGPAVAAATTAHAAGAHMAPMAADAHAPQVSAAGTEGTHCVSTPAHDSVPRGAAGLLALVILTGWTLTGQGTAIGSLPRRARLRGGRLGGGRSLLLRVCIART